MRCFGSASSLEACLTYFRTCPLFDKPGADIKWARWDSTIDKPESLLQWWWPYAAMVALLNLQHRVSRNLAEIHATALKKYKTARQRLNERAALGSKQDDVVDSGAGGVA